MKFKFNNIFFNQLNQNFYSEIAAEKFSKNPELIHINQQVAKELNLTKQDLENKNFAKYFSGNLEIKGSKTIATVYSGHQFGVFAGQLGDGRALLLGQIYDNKNQLADLQLKGSGKTPYSRSGDGRAVLRSSIREYLASQAFSGLKIPSTKALCLINTNEFAFREKPEIAAIITRITKTHIRFGHFEHFFYRKDYENLKKLTDFTIKNYFTEIDLKNDEKYELFFQETVNSTAKLIANWQAIGFCHGVMNTDNMSIIGETTDFGPFAFLEDFDQNFICNASDYQGRYAFNQQPSIALWNLKALAVSLQPLIDFEISQKYLSEFETILQKEYQKIIYKKFAFDKKITFEKNKIIQEFFEILEEEKADLTLSFRNLNQIFENEENFLIPFSNQQKIKNWFQKYKKQITISKEEFKKRINKTNPKFILRNWIAQIIIEDAQNQNYKILDDFLKILQNPFLEHKKFEEFARKAPKKYQNLIISCSS